MDVVVFFGLLIWGWWALIQSEVDADRSSERIDQIMNLLDDHNKK